MNANLLRSYTERQKTFLIPAAVRIQQFLEEYLENQPRIDRINARAKSVNSFIQKAKRDIEGNLVYSDPLNQIQDQIGARVVTFYKSDVERISTIVNSYFRSIEKQDVVPDTDAEFGYIGVHFILLCPSDIFENDAERNGTPNFFELQIKTMYQHAWSEANHDLGYKPDVPLDKDENRKVAFTAAQSWGADMIFDELFNAKKL